MVTKSKQSESKFVTVLAERIVKPLIAGYCSKKTSHESSKKDDLLKCPFCDKTSTSSPGMKGHITKMHQGKEDPKDKSNQGETKGDKEEILTEANKVIDIILKEIIEISENEKEEENLGKTLEKRKTTQCEKCDIILKESLLLKRHMRDTHDIRTDSTSPPHKKIKPVAEDLGTKIEMMETEEGSNLEDLRFKIEEIKIDAFEED